MCSELLTLYSLSPLYTLIRSKNAQNVSRLKEKVKLDTRKLLIVKQDFYEGYRIRTGDKFVKCVRLRQETGSLR